MASLELPAGVPPEDYEGCARPDVAKVFLNQDLEHLRCMMKDAVARCANASNLKTDEQSVVVIGYLDYAVKQVEQCILLDDGDNGALKAKILKEIRGFLMPSLHKSMSRFRGRDSFHKSAC